MKKTNNKANNVNNANKAKNSQGYGKNGRCKTNDGAQDCDR